MNGTSEALESVAPTSELKFGVCSPTARKTHPATHSEELQSEAPRTRLDRCEPSAVIYRESTIEKENRFLRANLILQIENERRRLQQHQQCDENPTSKRDSSDAGMDSVRLPSAQLLRAVREVFAPGRVALNEDISNGNSSSCGVTIEYSVDHIIVRGTRLNRMIFMQELLYTVLAHLETAASVPMDLSLPSTPSSRRAKHDTNVNGNADGEKTGEALIRGLRRALNAERVARERAEIAQRDAEHSKALAEAALRSERNRKELAKAEEIKETRQAQSLPCSPAQRNPQATSAAASGPDHKTGEMGRSPQQQEQQQQQQQQQQQGEMHALVIERNLLTRELKLRAATVERLHARLDAADAAAADICRDALAHFEARTPRGGFGETDGKTKAGDERKEEKEEKAARRVRGALSGARAADSAEGISERLSDAAVLLAAERRALRAAVEFAQNERDAVLLARKEYTSSSSSSFSFSPRAENAVQIRVPCEECGVLRQELQRCFGDMQRLRDALQAASAAQVTRQREAREHEQRANDAEKALQAAEKEHTREVAAAREREEALERQMHLIRASTRQLPLPSEGQTQRTWMGEVPTKTAHTALPQTMGTKSAAVDFLVTTPSRHSSTNNSIEQSCSSNILRKENFVRDLDAIYSK